MEEQYKKLTESDVAERLCGIDALILCHRNPDADTVGSALALAKMIRLAGGSAKAVCESRFPQRLAFILGDESGEYAAGDEDGRTVIAVDVASPVQLGELSGLADKTDFMIDHHGIGDVFADDLIRPGASSAGEVVTAILRIMLGEGMITPSVTALADICRCLYMALSSDTGSFKYSNTTPATFEAAAYLLERVKADPDGIDCAEISRHLFDIRTPAELAAKRLAVEKLRFFADGRLAITTLSLHDCKAAGITGEDCSDVIDVPRSVAGVEVGVTVKERVKGEYRISARSNCDFNVADVCARFGGGGHFRAAGASFFAGSAEDAENKVRDAFLDALEVYHG